MNSDSDMNLDKQNLEQNEPRHTTVIRISDLNYEKLRSLAFEERKSMRQLADELLEDALMKK